MAANLFFPNESAEYRAARNALLEAELDLRRQTEAVAAQRRALPRGGEVPHDYVFERLGADLNPETARMSELFDGHDSLILYSFMYGPERERPCPGCVSLLDSMDGAAEHVAQSAAFYIVAKSPIARLTALAQDRGWAHLKFVSTAGNAYDADYFGDTSKLPAGIRQTWGVKDGEDWDETMFNVFRREDDGTIRHFWGGELRYSPAEAGQDHRAGDPTCAIWGLLDMTPGGRGKFSPKLSYD